MLTEDTPIVPHDIIFQFLLSFLFSYILAVRVYKEGGLEMHIIRVFREDNN